MTALKGGGINLKNDILKAVPVNKYFMDLFTTGCGKRLCRFQLYPYGNRVIDGKLTENIVRCYVDYYMDIVKDTFGNRKNIIRKSNFLESVDLNNRSFAVREIGARVPLGIFEYSICVDYIKDARHVSKILAVYEEYYKDLRLYSSSNCYYGY